MSILRFYITWSFINNLTFIQGGLFTIKTIYCDILFIGNLVKILGGLNANSN